MMVLLVLALLTSSILLPSIIVLQKDVTSRILGKGPWLDFEESGSLEKSSVMDAVIDSNG